MVRLGAKGFYGLLAVGELAQSWGRKEPVQVKDIARKQKIPPDYLGQIMVVLRKANVVQAVRGPGGGYVLGRNPNSISVAEVLRALEGSMASDEFLAGRKKTVHSEMARKVSRVCQDAADASLRVLESTPISAIAERNGTESMFYI